MIDRGTWTRDYSLLASTVCFLWKPLWGKDYLHSSLPTAGCYSKQTLCILHMIYIYYYCEPDISSLTYKCVAQYCFLWRVHKLGVLWRAFIGMCVSQHFWFLFFSGKENIFLSHHLLFLSFIIDGLFCYKYYSLLEQNSTPLYHMTCHPHTLPSYHQSLSTCMVEAHNFHMDGDHSNCPKTTHHYLKISYPRPLSI